MWRMLGVMRRRGAARRMWVAAVSVPVLATVACTAGSSLPGVGPSGSPPSRAADPAGLRGEQVTGGPEHGWDIAFLPDGSLLISQRPGPIALAAGPRRGA